ncbi:MAG: hotdog fold thioesterase [Cytophagales bacterium]
MAETLEIEFTEITSNSLTAKMPVNHKTKQPYGILHGGASVALAETVGSIAGNLLVNDSGKMCVGLEINANHLRPASDGYVYAVATPLHLGSKTHVWDIKISNDDNKLVCVSRLTLAVIPKN